MNKFKHTKGPWKWLRDRYNDGYYGLYSGVNPVVYPQRRNMGDDGEAWFSSDETYYSDTALKEEDARLIAAAPALLDALVGLLEDIEGLIGESYGVLGLHLNGDVAEWGDLTPGGRFDRLPHILEAHEVINEVLEGDYHD